MSNCYQPNGDSGRTTQPYQWNSAIAQSYHDGSWDRMPTSIVKYRRNYAPHNVMVEQNSERSVDHRNMEMGGQHGIDQTNPHSDSYVVYNSIISRQDVTSQPMSRGGVPQHLEISSQYHQQQDYPARRSFQHPSLTRLNPSSEPNDLEFAQCRQAIIPVAPPFPPPPPPPEEYSSHSTSQLPTSAQPKLPTSSRDSNDEINKAVDAINALSNLEKRWSVAPASIRKRQQQPTGAKTAKRRKRRRKYKKTDEAGNNVGGSSEDIVTIRDTEEWIDVIDSLPTKISLQTTSPTNEGESGFPLLMEDSDPRLVSLAHDFPPLVSTSQDNDVARMDPLASYASVLKRSLESGGGNQASRDQVVRFLEDNNDEMDISDDEHEMQSGQYTGTCEGAEAYMSTDTLPTLQQEQDMRAKEKRALRIAELKAKAKLARAKLRMAEEKKARGQRVRELLESTEVEDSSLLSSLSLPPRLLSNTAVPGVQVANKTIVQACPIDEIRNVNSLLQETAQVNDTSKPQVITLSNEENGTKAKSLKQKLHLARLKVEIKKKELEKREFEMKKQSHSTRGFDTEATHPSEIPSKDEGVPQEHATHIGNLVNQSFMGKPSHKSAEDNLTHNNCETTKLRNKKTLGEKLEHLRRRQKELKQQNDSANLRHLIHRQKGLLQAQRQELAEISSQLQACADSLKSKQELLEQSDSRVEEMKHRKRIIEGIGHRATKQLMAARKTLSERRRKR